MADEDVNEEQWLYGDSNPDVPNDDPGEDNDNLYGDKFKNNINSNSFTQVQKLNFHRVQLAATFVDLT